MKEQVNLEELECNEFIQQFERYHERQTMRYQNGIETIRQLLGENDGFYATQTNEQAEIVLEVLEHQMIPQLKELFSDSEACAKTLFSKMQMEDQQ